MAAGRAAIGTPRALGPADPAVSPHQPSYLECFALIRKPICDCTEVKAIEDNEPISIFVFQDPTLVSMNWSERTFQPLDLQPHNLQRSKMSSALPLHRHRTIPAGECTQEEVFEAWQCSLGVLRASL